MPQMMPMNWFYLYLMFLLYYMLIFVCIFFCTSFVKVKMDTNYFKHFIYTWMW